LVYLTTAYPLYFGLNAMAGSRLDGDEAERVLVVEVAADELPEELFLPDEDFVAQGLAHVRGCGIEEIHEDIRDKLENYRDLATASATNMGNVAYRGTVLPHAITRYCLLDPTKQARLAWAHSAMFQFDSPLVNALATGKTAQEKRQLFRTADDF
jgi:hypothetical protein